MRREWKPGGQGARLRQGGSRGSAIAGSLSALLGALIWVQLSGCSPASKPFGGEVGQQVETALATGDRTFDHSAWDRLLAAATRDGLVDYEAMSSRRAELDEYLARVAEVDLASLGRDHLMALLINAYNAYTVTSILDHPGIESIREIDGVWDTRAHPVGGFQLTLDNIEHNLLRPYFKDPRIHVAVNCASMSCAPLPPWAFDGELIDQQLDDWTRRFFADEKYTRLDRENDTLRVSSLLDWYGDDFTAADAEPRADSLADFIARYAPQSTAEWIRERGDKASISFLEYDWSLNRAETEKMRRDPAEA